MPLVEFEKQVLRHLAGEPEPDIISGAAYNVACETLKSEGLIDSRWLITDKGRQYIAEEKFKSNSSETETSGTELQSQPTNLET